MEFLRDLYRKHQALKAKIHSTRIPLGRKGQLAMTAFYVSIPLISGYFIMDWATSKANQKWEVIEHPDGTKEYKIPDAVRERGGIPKSYVAGSYAQTDLIKEQIEREKTQDANLSRAVP
mmetsp:Transcript_12602/g.24435  ORF Transcript_12602/g.24435 Transcript_12602/m.24435 type:complete len:119 (+) Transcript_12602:283-639(+)|eukprot:CAMPEP_0171490862 /NCGR_PEP_ID=MMETSP0958-20121227/3545_1 /TAXON_ID=87120 /ORGANISM="Aurantiochytrium limacinum, Strain ATCCMYA-1381" /LENGTH=118 /DNA_ID=CAMNT_0012024227 /DNA_START=175 /DNA_END=531 /DNA_ORIENTATION=+